MVECASCWIADVVDHFYRVHRFLDLALCLLVLEIFIIKLY